MWPYPLTHVGTPSHLGHMERVAATMPSQAHAGAAQEAPNIGQLEGQDVPLVRPSSCTVKGGIPSSRRYLPTYLPCWAPCCPLLCPAISDPLPSGQCEHSAEQFARQRSPSAPLSTPAPWPCPAPCLLASLTLSCPSSLVAGSPASCPSVPLLPLSPRRAPCRAMRRANLPLPLSLAAPWCPELLVCGTHFVPHTIPPGAGCLAAVARPGPPLAAGGLLGRGAPSSFLPLVCSH